MGILAETGIDGVAQHGVDASITETIIHRAHNLGVRTVAEEVEAKARYHFLEARGCDELQGYLYSQPLEFAAF